MVWCASDTDRRQYLTTKVCCSIRGHLRSTHHVMTAKVASCGKVDYSNYLKDRFRAIGRYAIIFIFFYRPSLVNDICDIHVNNTQAYRSGKW